MFKIKNALLTIGLIFAIQVAYAALPKFNQYVFFGDSLTDMGNYIAQTTQQPCVDVTAPVTNQGGSTWANVNEYGFYAVPSNMSGGNDWAVAGDETGDVYNNQIANFLSQSKVDPTALYVIWAGANDIAHKIFENPHPEDAQQVIAEGMSNVQMSIQKLYSAGARNFLIIGVPNISDAPIASNPTADPQLLIGVLNQYQKQLAAICNSWNEALFSSAGLLVSIKSQYTDIHFYTWDPNLLLTPLINSPSVYGFPATINNMPNNYTGWCTGVSPNPQDPNNYIFFNYLHPTPKLHALIAKNIRNEAEEI